MQGGGKLSKVRAAEAEKKNDWGRFEGVDLAGKI